MRTSRHAYGHTTQRNRGRRAGGEEVPFDYDSWLKLESGIDDWIMMQELENSTAFMTNAALALGRRLNSLLYADYTAGAQWSNPSAQIARQDSNGSSNLSLDTILAVGKTYTVTFTMSNYSAGDLRIALGSSIVGTFSSNGVHTATGTCVGETKFQFSPLSAFRGDIDLNTVSVKQTLILADTSYPGAEELNEAGASGTATVANWTQGNSATLTNPSVGVLRVARNGLNNPDARQVILTTGLRYGSGNTMQAKSDGNATPRVVVGGVVAWLGVNTHTNWQDVDFEEIAGNTTFNCQSLTATGTEYTEWRNISITEANPMNSTNTALTVGVPSASSRVGFLYSGNATTSVLNFYSAELNSKINWENGGTMMTASVDTWAAGIDVLWRVAVDANNEIYILRSETSLIWVYEQTTTQSIITLANADVILGTGEFTIGMSWDVAGVGMQAYLKGVQQGANQSIAAAIIGNIASTMAVMFANASTAGNSWAGDGSRLGFAYTTPTATQHLDYYTNGGL